METGVKKILILVFVAALFSQCNKQGQNSAKTTQTGFTNISDQEYILITQELDAKNFEKVIDYVDKFFQENSLKEENLKLLNLKAEAKERLAGEFKDIKKYKDKIEQYNFKVVKNKVIYLYEEYQKIWEEFPETEYGKSAFYKVLSIVSNNNEKINYYKTYIESVKNSIHLNELKFELSKLYLNEVNHYTTELVQLYNDLLKGDYKNEVILNYYILKFKLDKDFVAYKKNLEILIEGKNINGVLGNYLLGDINFIENNLDEAKKYYSTAKNMIKNIDEKKEKLGLIIGFGPVSASLIEKIKNNVNHKMVLIDKVLSYRKNLIDKNFAIINGERVRIRKNPLVMRNNVVTSLNYGDRVIIIKKKETADKIEGEEHYWYFVQLMDNTSGWVYGKYLMFFTY